MYEYEHRQLKKQWPLFKEKIYQPLKERLDNGRNRYKVATLESMFQETDEPTLELENSRNELIAHVAEVMKGRGGSSQSEADQTTEALIEKVGEAFRAVALDVSATKKQYDAREVTQLQGILEADDEIRRQQLQKFMPKYGTMVAAASPQYLRSIAYSFADPEIDSLTDDRLRDKIQIFTPNQAISIYKQIVTLQTAMVLVDRRPNVTEFGDPHSRLKKAVVAIGTAAIISLIFSDSKSKQLK